MREVGTHAGGPRYLNAYVNGIQFVLLAIEGRLANLPDRIAKADVLEAMYEYHEMAMRLRDRVRGGEGSDDPLTDDHGVEPRVHVQLRDYRDRRDDDGHGVSL